MNAGSCVMLTLHKMNGVYLSTCSAASQPVIDALKDYLLIQSNLILMVLIINLQKIKHTRASLYSVPKSPQPCVCRIRNLVWLCYCDVTVDSTIDGAT